MVQVWVSDPDVDLCFKLGQLVCSIPPALCHIGYINNRCVTEAIQIREFPKFASITEI